MDSNEMKFSIEQIEFMIKNKEFIINSLNGLEELMRVAESANVNEFKVGGLLFSKCIDNEWIINSPKFFKPIKSAKQNNG